MVKQVQKEQVRAMNLRLEPKGSSARIRGTHLCLPSECPCLATGSLSGTLPSKTKGPKFSPNTNKVVGVLRCRRPETFSPDVTPQLTLLMNGERPEARSAHDGAQRNSEVLEQYGEKRATHSECWRVNSSSTGYSFSHDRCAGTHCQLRSILSNA